MKIGSQAKFGEDQMDRFEFDISRHSAESFTKVAYFCTEKGDCSVEDIPVAEDRALLAILNERGLLGWELVQLFFAENGLIACWKRKITEVIDV